MKKVFLIISLAGMGGTTGFVLNTGVNIYFASLAWNQFLYGEPMFNLSNCIGSSTYLAIIFCALGVLTFHWRIKAISPWLQLLGWVSLISIITYLRIDDKDYLNQDTWQTLIPIPQDSVPAHTLYMDLFGYSEESARTQPAYITTNGAIIQLYSKLSQDKRNSEKHGKQSHYHQILKDHASLLEEHWQTLEPAHKMVEALNQYPAIPDLTESWSSKPVSFNLTRHYLYATIHYVQLKTIQGPGSDPLKILIPFLELNSKRVPYNRTLVNSMICDIETEHYLETIHFILDHSNPTTTSLRQTLEILKTYPSPKQSIETVLLAEHIIVKKEMSQFPDIIHAIFHIPPDPEGKSLDATLHRLFKALSRHSILLMFNPKASINAHYQIQQKMIESNFEDTFIPHRFFPIKNTLGRQLVREAIPSYAKMNQKFRDTASKRTELITRIENKLLNNQ